MRFYFRFEQERGFKGADRAAPRDGPVQFQREEDPFGLSDFLKDVRHGSGSAPSANPSSSSSSKRTNADDREERTSEKRRKK
jgi:SNW domain-containing protein 1